MAYIGTSPQNGVRNRFVYAATQSQTAFTGADADSKTLVVSDQLYTDVYQNGVKLKLTTDWTATATTVTLVNAASADDVIEIVSFDVFSVNDTVPASTGGTFSGGISATTFTGSGASLTGFTSSQMPTGSVLQVVHTQYTTAYYNADSSSRTDIPDFAATITPSSTSSKVLLIVHASMFLNCDGALGIARNGTAIFNNFLGTDRTAQTYNVGGEAGSYLDSPSSTSAVVYQMYTIVTGCGNDVYINRSTSGAIANGRSGITLMEIAG